MDDTAEIIYIALSNNILLYKDTLEGDLDEENRNMVNYIIGRSEQLLSEYEDKIKNKDTKIQRPNWENLKPTKM